MKITFHGAAQTVTGSQHLLEVNGAKILLECGLFQGRRQESFERNRTIPFDISDLDAVLLSHAHIDHSGNLPNLIRNGYTNPIYATIATTDLADVMLRDAGHIQEADAEFVNKRRARRGEPPIEPIYTQEDAARVRDVMVPLQYEMPTEIAPGVTATFFDAGHLLGSAGIALDIEEKGRTFRLWFSGDIGRPNLPLLKDPVLPFDADYLMMECTYGDKPHDNPTDAYEELLEITRRTYERGGKVIIPSFAVGRTQELVYWYDEMMTKGELPRIPIFVDSPLAVHATDVYRRHPECLDDETQQFVMASRHPALFSPQVTYIHSVEESKSLNNRKDPMIIISASGMAEVGRILHHLRNNIEDPKNTIIIVSWQAPYTLGRRLADRETRVRIFGETYTRKAEIATIGGLSSHAGQTFLLQYAEALKGRVKDIFLVHGEPRGAKALTEKLREHGFNRIHYPEAHTSVEL